MATDVARLSYDPGRHYTGTIAQQGRVSLEAEENEQYAILAEERLRDLRDIVGPAGTPDDGYAVSDAGGGDLTIGAGTMYVGGLRVELDDPVLYSAQPDWRDHAGDPAFVQPSAGRGTEHVVLVLTEYDVTATEDPVLREAALGGPDGAARSRIVQRVRRIASSASDCAEALRLDERYWLSQGLVFDHRSMRLRSAGRLQVVWADPPAAPDPCEPGGAGGYLGAENQAIRVQVSAVDEKTGTFSVVWGWDNASMLYRVTADAAVQPTLTLDRAPVDEYHNPRSGQPVEVLRAAADLNSLDGVTEGWAAALTGTVAVLAAPYDPDLRTVGFPSALPAPYRDPDQTPQLYLRVWEELHTGVAFGDEVLLAGTGLKVRITAIAKGAPAHVGDFWTIGVRPATPENVLPARLLRTPQPPDGPRMWACPLAVISWTDRQFRLLDDCRVPFPPLTALTQGSSGCCTVSVGPADAERLQEIVDHAVAGRKVHDVTGRVTVCLSPGRYVLTRPLVLTEEHSELHLEGCGEGAVLTAEPTEDGRFTQGLVVLVQAADVRISGITFEPPLVAAGGGGARTGWTGGGAGLKGAAATLAKNLFAAIALRPVECRGLIVEGCDFRLGLNHAAYQPGLVAQSPEETTAATVAMARNKIGLLAGIFTGGRCPGMRLSGNTFQNLLPAESRSASTRVAVVGVLASSALRSLPARQSADSEPFVTVPCVLSELVVRDNRFTDVTVGFAAFGHLGEMQFTDNTLRGGYGGVWLYAFDSTAYLDQTGQYTTHGMVADGVSDLRAAVATLTLDPVLLLLLVAGRTYPLPGQFVSYSEPAPAEMSPTDWTHRFLSRIATSLHGKSAPAPADAPVDFNAGVGSRKDLITAGGPEAAPLRDAALTIADLERTIGFAAALPEMKLRCHGNLLECVQPDAYSRAGTSASSGPTGPALVVWNHNADTTGDETDQTRAYYGGQTATAVVDGNELTANTEGPVAALLLVTTTSVTGNLVRRTTSEGVSLAVLGTTRGGAVTGNVLFGRPLLPANRAFPAPLDTWLPFNDVV